MRNVDGVHPLPLVHEPDRLSRPLVKRGEHPQPDVPSFYPAVPPHTYGPSFPGAQADSPLSRAATSPLRLASRPLFKTRVFQSIAFPCERASTDVRESLGSRARFRALCRTPRFFEPRRRQTNSAIRSLTHGHTPRTAVLARIDLCRYVSALTGHPVGRIRATKFLAGLHPEAYAPEPELWRLPPVKELALNSRGPGDPSEGPTEVDSPPQATSRASVSPPRFEVGVGAPSSCIVTAEDPRRTTPREGYGFPSDRDAFHCFGTLAWSGFDPRARLDHLAVTPTPRITSESLPR